MKLNMIGLLAVIAILTGCEQPTIVRPTSQTSSAAPAIEAAPSKSSIAVTPSDKEDSPEKAVSIPDSPAASAVPLAEAQPPAVVVAPTKNPVEETKPVVAEAVVPSVPAAEPLKPAPKLDPPVEAKAEPPKTTEVALAPSVDTRYAFAEDAGGKLIEGHLAPPQQMPLAPVPFVAQPRARNVRGPGAEWSLLPVEMPLAPHGLPAPAAMAFRPRSVLDLPILAVRLVPECPLRPVTSPGPKAYAVGPDPERLPPLPPLGRTAVTPVLPTDDPTLESARVSALQLVPLNRTAPAPILNLSIVDPFAQIRQVELKNPPPETEPPASSPAGRVRAQMTITAPPAPPVAK